MINQIQIASEPKDSNLASTLAHETRKNNMFRIISVVLVSALLAVGAVFLQSCGDDGDDVKDISLVGSTFECRGTFSNEFWTEHYAFTIKFTSETEGVMRAWNNMNDLFMMNDNFTYTISYHQNMGIHQVHLNFELSGTLTYNHNPLNDMLRLYDVNDFVGNVFSGCDVRRKNDEVESGERSVSFALVGKWEEYDWDSSTYTGNGVEITNSTFQWFSDGEEASIKFEEVYTEWNKIFFPFVNTEFPHSWGVSGDDLSLTYLIHDELHHEWYQRVTKFSWE